MDLSLTESQEMLRAAARAFVEREAPGHVIVALQREESSLPAGLWRKAAELGWLGILVPAEYGGSESALTDVAVLFEELGRAPLPGPFFSSGVLGALTVLEAGSAAQRRAILPAVASGETVLSVAITEPNASWGAPGITLHAPRADGHYRLDGAKVFVSDATEATHLIVAARTGAQPEDISLLLVDARARGVHARRLPGLLAGQCEVTFDGVAVETAGLLGERENRGCSSARCSARCPCCARTWWAAARRSSSCRSPTAASACSSGCRSAASSACRTTSFAW